MDTFINLIHCCAQEEQNNFEFKVPMNVKDKSNPKNKNIVQIETEPIITNDLSKNKSNENNNTMNTLNNAITNNTSNNLIDDSFNNINNNNNSNVNFNIKESKLNNSIQNLQNIPSPPPSSKKKIIYCNSISHNHFSINKMINNMESKKSLFSKNNVSKNNNNASSNKGSVLTLNNLILNNSNLEDKKNELGSKILLSGELLFWKEIIITSNGLKNSLRKKSNDHVFLGVKNITDKSGESYNDLIVNFFYQEEDAGLVETKTGRTIEIFYNKKLKEFFLHFLHPNLILYYKINTFVYFTIGKEYYFLLGNTFMSINVKKTQIEKIINIQIEIENNKPIKYSFRQNQAPIKIGRGKTEINIFNSSISKVHGIIEYSKNSQSFYYKDMGSTNGSTLIIKESDTLKIKGEMNFKLEDVPFKIQEIP